MNSIQCHFDDRPAKAVEPVVAVEGTLHWSIPDSQVVVVEEMAAPLAAVGVESLAVEDMVTVAALNCDIREIA